MAWTDITRPIYERNNVRYASDCLDEEWAIIEPLLPEPNVVGRPRTTEMRDVWDGVQYMASTGCQWRMIPKDFPPRSTIQGYFYDWRGQWRVAPDQRDTCHQGAGIGWSCGQSKCRCY